MILRRRFFRGPIRPIQCGTVAEGSTPTYAARLVYGPPGNLKPLPGSAVSSARVTIVDVQTDEVINDCDEVDFFARGGQIDTLGNLTLPLLPGDTLMDEVPSGMLRIERGVVLDGTYNYGSSVFRHEAVFEVVRLSAMAVPEPIFVVADTGMSSEFLSQNDASDALIPIEWWWTP